MSIAAQIRRAAAGVDAGGAAFDPETDITWHSLFWAEGTDFQAQGYSDTDAVSTWPNETGEADATEATATPSYDAVNAAYNSQPTVDFTASNQTKLTTANFSSAPTYPISVVVIGNFTVGGNHTIVDGNDSTNRNAILIDAGGTAWRIFATTGTITGGTADSNPHLFVGKFDGSTGNETLVIDGTTTISGSNAGSAQLDGIRIGNIHLGTIGCEGHVALVGIYEGDIESDGSWADFETWAEDHYGLTIA